MGVHFRGTTYKTTVKHTFPPSPKLMIENVKNIIEKKKYTKIFLCTEEQKYLELFKKHFKEMLLYFNSYRSKENDAFKIYPRKNHRYKLGRAILIETLLLSNCEGLTCINSNVKSASIFFSKKKQDLFTIFLGFNSRNKYIARWLWYMKKLLPSFLGGFKIKNI